MTTLEKLRRLEKYIASDAATVDPLVETTIDKLLQRETARLQELKRRLTQQCQQFEVAHGRPSGDFYSRYEAGQMGDDPDIVEWAATIEMLAKVERRLSLLQVEVAQ